LFTQQCFTLKDLDEYTLKMIRMGELYLSAQSLCFGSNLELLSVAQSQMVEESKIVTLVDQLPF
jgi:hypothetical protein